MDALQMYCPPWDASTEMKCNAIEAVVPCVIVRCFC